MGRYERMKLYSKGSEQGYYLVLIFGGNAWRMCMIKTSLGQQIQHGVMRFPHVQNVLNHEALIGRASIDPTVKETPHNLENMLVFFFFSAKCKWLKHSTNGRKCSWKTNNWFPKISWKLTVSSQAGSCQRCFTFNLSDVEFCLKGRRMLVGVSERLPWEINLSETISDY